MFLGSCRDHRHISCYPPSHDFPLTKASYPLFNQTLFEHDSVFALAAEGEEYSTFSQVHSPFSQGTVREKPLNLRLLYGSALLHLLLFLPVFCGWDADLVPKDPYENDLRNSRSFMAINQAHSLTHSHTHTSHPAS